MVNSTLALSGVSGEGWDPQYLKMVSVPRNIPSEVLIPDSFERFAEFSEFCARESRKAA